MAKLFNNDDEYTVSFEGNDAQVVDIAVIRPADTEPAKLVIGVTRNDEEFQEVTFTPQEAQTLRNHLNEQNVQDILGSA